MKKVIARTEPEFVKNISKSSAVTGPVAVEVFAAVQASLDNLNNTPHLRRTLQFNKQRD